MARLTLALALLAACSMCANAFFFFPPPFYGGLYGGGLGGFGGGTTVVVVNGRKLQDAKCRTALDVMRDTPDLSQMAALIPSMSPKLREAFSSHDGADFTAFLPTNGALNALKDALPGDAFGMLMHNGSTLTALQSYSIIPGRRIAMSDLGRAPLRTALGDAVAPLSATGSTLQGIGSRAAVVKGDLQACHATLHIVDRVLFPIAMPREALSNAADKVKSAMTQG